MPGKTRPLGFALDDQRAASMRPQRNAGENVRGRDLAGGIGGDELQ